MSSRPFSCCLHRGQHHVVAILSLINSPRHSSHEKIFVVVTALTSARLKGLVKYAVVKRYVSIGIDHLVKSSTFLTEVLLRHKGHPCLTHSRENSHCRLWGYRNRVHRDVIVYIYSMSASWSHNPSRSLERYILCSRRQGGN